LIKALLLISLVFSINIHASETEAFGSEHKPSEYLSKPITEFNSNEIFEIGKIVINCRSLYASNHTVEIPEINKFIKRSGSKVPKNLNKNKNGNYSLERVMRLSKFIDGEISTYNLILNKSSTIEAGLRNNEISLTEYEDAWRELGFKKVKQFKKYQYNYKNKIEIYENFKYKLNNLIENELPFLNLTSSKCYKYFKKHLPVCFTEDTMTGIQPKYTADTLRGVFIDYVENTFGLPS
jgi:hypothetical protein